jgi:hypothetical protein
LRRIACILVYFFAGLTLCQAQALVTESEDEFLKQLKTGAPMPEKMLSTRAAVFYTYSTTDTELEKVQQSFQKTGVDAVIYFVSDYLFANKDVLAALASYLTTREITNLVFLQKKPEGYGLYFMEFNGKPTLVEPNQYAWSMQDRVLSDLLTKTYRAGAAAQKKLNLLVNDVPETGIRINPILGRRSDFFAIDLKIDPIAIPKTGNEAQDKQLEALFATYPYKYKFTEPGLTEKELRKQGFYYVLCMIHARGKIAKELLGYDMTKAESAIVSVTYPDGQQVLSSYAADEPVYKFYIKHIDSQNVFLGTKWDADVTWQAALQNHLKAFKVELKIP